MKNKETRFNEVINYVKNINEEGLAEQLTTILGGITTQNRDKIIGELSLGSREKNEKQYSENTIKRNALRALLLCQRVFFSDLWMTFNGTPYTYLENRWKDKSIAFWSNKTEKIIEDAIRIFTRTKNNNLEELVRTAENNGPTNSFMLPNFELTRQYTHPFPIESTCYKAVMSWLLKSGLVSYCWYLKNQGASDKISLTNAFGPGTKIWESRIPFSINNYLPEVPRGHIIHMYDTFSWRGHWLKSTGAGLACGCNNDPEREQGRDINSNYSTTCSIKNQFLNSFNSNGKAGIVEIINPLLIPEKG